jgi:hypothetical protein
MDCKGFTRITVFKGVGWIKWRNQFMTLARLAHPRVGHKLLKAAASNSSTIDDVQLFTPADIPFEEADEFSTDIVSTLGFLVEGEAHDMLCNCQENGLELWRRLEARFNHKTKSRTLNDMNSILNPEAAKSLGEVMGTIERWEERISRLDDPSQINVTMKAALLGRLCPKKLRDHIELHMSDKHSYHEIKDEIIRVLDTGLLGKVGNDKGEGGDKVNSPMEIDPLLNNDWVPAGHTPYLQGDVNAFMKGGGKGGWKGGKGGAGGPWGGKGPSWGAPGKGGDKGGAKGEGGKKGGGKGKGKDQNPMEFQGYCSYCFAWGHTQRYCPKRQKDWQGGKGGANALEGMEEVYVEPVDNNEAYEFDNAVPLGGLGYQCGFTGTSYNGCCSEALYSPHTAAPTAPTPHTRTSATTPLTRTPTPTHNMFASLYQEYDDTYAQVQNIGRLAALETPPAVNNVMSIGSNKYKPGSVKLKIMGDSGAADCVLPANLFTDIPLKVGGPKVGRKYTAADGKHICNLGVRTLVGTTQEGHKRKIDFEVAEVTKPLASFSKITKAGHRIILDNDVGQGGYIENKTTGERTALYLENDVYLFDLYVDVGASAGFPRQGRKA